MPKKAPYPLTSKEVHRFFHSKRGNKSLFKWAKESFSTVSDYYKNEASL